MRRVALLISSVALLLLAFALTPRAVQADESVVGSKHDLSRFGPGPVRALDESRVCIFCHAPHNASPAAPLWNRHNPVNYYRIYDSSTTDARIDQPGPASKMCLSCHDGTVALGLVMSRPATDPIPMTHAFVPADSDLTTDLSDDHPVGFRYDRSLSNKDPQLRPPQLVDSRIALGPRGELECVACHDPHNNEYTNFLRIPQQQGALCLTCHNLDGWRSSAHALSGRVVPPTAVNGEQLPHATMADNACRSCHVSHGAPQRERLLYAQSSQLCLNCHDGVGATDILPALDQRFGHRIDRLLPDRREPDRRFRGSRRVECSDCHNPHAVENRPQALQRPGPQPTTVLVPPAMQEVRGVTINGLPKQKATFYYEVCFRCHADRPVVVTDRVIRQQDAAGNVRRQFVPTTASAHPVAFPARASSEDVPSLLPQWRTGGFLSCQDCHNSPDAGGAGGLGVEGPHTSRFRYLLVENYDTADFTVESAQSYALCYRCHDRNSILGDESFALHNQHVVRGQSPCSACHSAHGVQGSRERHDHLINFDISIVQGERLFLDTGRRRGSCTLTCHGVRHVNFTYGP